MAKKRFFLGTLTMALVFGLVLAGCSTESNSDDPPAPTFDGSTLAGTTWVAEEEQDEMIQGMMGVKKIKSTLAFTSDTAGTATGEITQWADGATEEQKTKMNGMMNESSGPFTSTYDSTAKTGTYTLKDGTTGTFTVDAAQKNLTTTEVEDGETQTTVYKLQ